MGQSSPRCFSAREGPAEEAQKALVCQTANTIRPTITATDHFARHSNLTPFHIVRGRNMAATAATTAPMIAGSSAVSRACSGPARAGITPMGG
jgi:hypothetical protein